MPTTQELAEHLLRTSPEHVGWSLVESPNAAGSYEDLRRWATEMTFQTWSLDRTVRPYHLGLVLLWLESEAARRHGGDGAVWPVLSNRQIAPWTPLVHAELFGPGGYATQLHRDLLRSTAKYHSLRNTFEEEDAQNWYRLIYLQFGFTRDDAVERLAGWLSGQILPVSVQKLLEANDSGARAFQQLWRSLRMFRLGNLDKAVLESRLKCNPWVLPEWCNALVAAAKRSSAQILEVADLDAAELRFFTAPQLVWPSGGLPFFTTSLCNLKELGLESPEYHFKAGNQILARLIRQPDQTYYCSPAEEALTLPLQPSIVLSLVNCDGQIAVSDQAVLWDTAEEVSVLSGRTGLRIPTDERLRPGNAVNIITSGDISIHPSAEEIVPLPLGYSLHRVAAGWGGVIQASLDDEPIWTSAVGSGPTASDTPDVSAHFTEQLDLRLQKWNQVAPPWKLPIKIRIQPDWKFVRLRWQRGDGALVELNSLPQHLTLTEKDAAHPVVLRVRITDGARFRTVVVKVHVPFVAVMKWDSTGVPRQHKPDKNLLLGDARRLTWSFCLPAVNGEAKDPRECSLAEGNSLLGRLKARPTVLAGLAGYGAGLTILDDPYQSDKPLLEVASGVFDDGVIGAVTRFPDGGGYNIGSRFTDLNSDHGLHIWGAGSDSKSTVTSIPLNSLLPRDSGWIWPTDDCSQLHAVALTFRGARLGAWFNPASWSDTLLNNPPASPAQSAAMLRAWKAPILSGNGNHRTKVVQWISLHWAEILPVWLTREPVPGPTGATSELWAMPPPNQQWEAAVGDLLTEASPMPDPESAGDIVKALAPGKKGVDAIGHSVWVLARVCPILTARVAQIYLENFVLAKDRGVFFQRFLSLPELAESDERAAEIARIHGNRDGVWLQQTAPPLRQIGQNEFRKMPRPYRLLVKSEAYRNWVLGRWLRQIR